MSAPSRLATNPALRAAGSSSSTSRLLSSSNITKTAATLPTRRPFHTTMSHLAADENGNALGDGLAEGGSARGATGGGKPLDSSAPHAPPRPKISNLSVPGTDKSKDLTEEQKKEVEEHNRDFAAKHDKSERAPEDKVDKKFWKNRPQ